MSHPTRTSAVPTAPAETDRPDFVLRETADGWTLTICLGDRLLDALAGYHVDGDADPDGEAPSAGFTVAVHPNLVPGTPFPTSVRIERPHTV